MSEREEQRLINECNHESEQIWIENTNDLKAQIQKLEAVVEAAKRVLDEGNDTEEDLAAWDQLANALAHLDGEKT